MYSRREILMGLSSVGLASLAGCADSRDADDYPPIGPTEPEDEEDEEIIGLPETDVDLVDYSYEEISRDEVENFRDPWLEVQGDQIIVRGSFFTGSSSCSEGALHEVEVGGPAVGVIVGTKLVEKKPTACTDDIATTSYKVTLTFEGTLPEKVTITEVEFDGREIQTTIPVVKWMTTTEV